MKFIVLFFSFLALSFSSCNLREKEEALNLKEAQLNEKEQELLLKERTLQLKEEELSRAKEKLDSTALVDTTALFNQALIGTWAVRMTCTQTSCPGSAVGDTKTETWEINYQGKYVVARVMVNNELVRTYSGTYNGNTLELVQRTESSATEPETNITIRLKLVNETQLEGTREIERIGDCKITYSVKMDKK